MKKKKKVPKQKDDIITVFTNIASKHGVLEKDEEKRLIRLVQEDDDQVALDKLVKHNMRLIIKIAKKHTNQGLEFSDLIQEGQTGLVHAVKKFDLSRGALSTYATHWIRQKMTRAIGDLGRPIRIPFHVLSEISIIKRCYRDFVETYGEIPTPEDLVVLVKKAKEEAIIKLKSSNKPKNIKKALTKLPEEIDQEYIENLGRLLHSHTSLDSDKSGEENITVGDSVAGDYYQQPEIIIEDNQNKDYIFQLLDTLEPDEKSFIMLRFGFIDYKEKTKRQMSAITRMTENEAKKKEDYILEKLKAVADIEKVCI